MEPMPNIPDSSLSRDVPENQTPVSATEFAAAPEQPAVPASDCAPRKKRRHWLAWLLLLALVVMAGEGLQRWRIERVIDSALDKLDVPYILGATGPDAYDCSSLVQRCFADGWKQTPRLAVEIGYCESFRKIEGREKLLRGDVVCFDTESDGDLSDHVGIYLGNNRFIHASSGKGRVVVSELTGYYETHFSWGLRLIRHIPVELPFFPYAQTE